MVFQAPSLIVEPTAMQNVTLSLRLRGINLHDAEARALQAMAEVGTDDLRDAYSFELSGNE